MYTVKKFHTKEKYSVSYLPLIYPSDNPGQEHKLFSNWPKRTVNINHQPFKTGQHCTDV